MSRFEVKALVPSARLGAPIPRKSRDISDLKLTLGREASQSDVYALERILSTGPLRGEPDRDRGAPIPRSDGNLTQSLSKFRDRDGNRTRKSDERTELDSDTGPIRVGVDDISAQSHSNFPLWKAVQDDDADLLVEPTDPEATQSDPIEGQLTGQTKDGQTASESGDTDPGTPDGSAEMANVADNAAASNQNANEPETTESDTIQDPLTVQTEGVHTVTVIGDPGSGLPDGSAETANFADTETAPDASSLFQICAGDFVADGEVISDRHFGGIYTTFFGLRSFAAQYDMLSLGHVRWPGGTRGEMALDTKDVDSDGDTGEYLFDLRADDMFLVAGKGLSDLFAFATLTGATVSTFLPTQRYFGDAATAAADAVHFMNRLLDGAFGQLPSRLTIEIGNESLDGSLETAAAYGIIADAQLAAIRQVAEARGIDLGAIGVDVAVQIGRSAEEDQAIRDQLGPDALGMVDALIAHHLPINIRNHNVIRDATAMPDEGDSRFTRSLDYIDAWEEAVAPHSAIHQAELDFYVSAWTVGGSNDPAPGDLAYHDFGARQARTTVDTFARIVATGADGASLWGIDARSNPNWYSRMENGEVILSHGGEAFLMMAESLPGTRLLEGFAQPVPETWDGLYNDFWVYAYEGDDHFVFFAAANDLDGTAAVGLRVPGIDPDAPIEMTRLGTRMDPYMPDIAMEEELRLWERPDVSETTIWSTGELIEFNLLQDYELVRLIAYKDPTVGGLTSSDEGGFTTLCYSEGVSSPEDAWALAAQTFETDLLA